VKIRPISRTPRSGGEEPFPTSMLGPVRILCISGSLRARSSNLEVLRAVSSLAPKGVRIAVYSGLAELPHFNPDLDEEGMEAPPAVSDLRRRVDDADALLVSSPEYAHGVPGSLKNALDWLVSDPGVVGKPVGLLNLAPRARHAQESLTETLRTMSLTVVPAASITVDLSGRRLEVDDIVTDGHLAAALREALEALVSGAQERRLRRARSIGSAS